MSEGWKPVPIRVRLPYAAESDFAEGYANHVSRAGIFVPAARPWAVGTCLTFEFLLSTGQVLLRGEAVVAKTSEAGAGVRAGMTLRFLQLDEDSRAVLDRLFPQPASQTLILGIDLGTTGTRVAVVRGAGPELVQLGQEGPFPSAVAVDARGQLLVGTGAQMLSRSEAKHVVVGAKRWLGRRYEPAAAAHVPFRMVPDDRNEIAAMLRTQRLPITHVCAEILRRARTLAEASLGTQLSRAVIGVPAHFNERQRAALRKAAALAGFSVELLVNDPAAAATAYASGRQLPRRRLAVVDFGGGTFDASVVQVEGDQLEVVATGGDSHFGGMDFDTRIASLLAGRFGAQSSVSLADDWEAQQRLRHAAETAKIALSGAEETQVALPAPLVRGGGRSTHLTRLELEALCADLVERVAEITGEVLQAAKLAPRDIDEVLLLGGMTRMPMVRRRFDRLFPRSPIVDMGASPAVAFGAALLGASMLRSHETLGLKDILGSTLSVQLPDGQLKSVFGRHTPLPAERHLEVEGPPGSRDLRVPVFQGSAGDPHKDSLLGALELRGLVPGPSGSARAILTFSISKDGLAVSVESGGTERRLELNPLDATELPVAVVEGEGVGEPLMRRAGGR